MTKQKRGFWTFVFSLIPGAGEMYMGFMKQGISIMSIFWILIGLSGLFSASIFLLGLPILWFYSFFNVHNLKGLSEEEFYSIQDDYALHLEAFLLDKKEIIQKYYNLIAFILILVGISIIWNVSYDMLVWLLPRFMVDFVYRIGNMVPQILLGFGIIVLGISMIRSKKRQLEKLEDLENQ